MAFRYTTEQLKFLRSSYKSMQVTELTCAFNSKFDLCKTEAQIKSTLTNHKIKCGRKTGVRKGVFISFSQTQAAFIRTHYTRLSLSDLTAAFNKEFEAQKTIQQIRCFTRNHNIKSGRTGQFIKGSKPWNTGTKGLIKPNSGNFKKGNKPENLKPLGSERVGTDGYILMKINETNPYTGFPTRYKAKHIVIWEQENGPVPKGYVVILKDGNKLNCVLDNLEMITRRELCLLNKRGYADVPAEMKETLRAIVKVEVKRFDLLKGSS